MDRAGKLIARMRVPGGGLSPEDLARAAWPQAVGKKIASHALAVSLARSCLVVEVEDPVWRGQLARLEGQILARLREILGPELVTRIDFRLRIPRRLPQPAGQRQAATDEADGIADPVLRHLYKSSRRKSSA